jgi:hypothetical protein
MYFFQIYHDDMLKLIDALASKICLIPGILADCKADSKTRNYYYSFLKKAP